jgi:hypothetical protein
MKTVNEILTSALKNVDGLLVSNNNLKSSIYKKDLFNGLEQSQKKATRKKIRNMTLSYFKSILATKDKKSLQKLVQSFDEFYKQIYLVNDYSFQSVTTEKNENKELIKNALEIVKKELNIK